MTTRLLLRWELRDALRSYWFLANAAIFLIGGMLLLLFGSESAVLGSRGFGRALAALVQLALFFVPLMALFPSTASIAGDRELGTLDFILAQPLTRGELYRGRWAGVAAALSLSLLIAFGATGLVAALRGVSTALVAALLGLTLLLGAAFVSLGLWISAGAATRTRATSIGLAAWLAFVALGSLGLMTAFARWGLPAWALEAWALIDPVEAYRLAALDLLGAERELLGPAGSALSERLGSGGLVGAACVSLVAWTGVGFAGGLRRFGRPVSSGGGGRT